MQGGMTYVGYSAFPLLLWSTAKLINVVRLPYFFGFFFGIVSMINNNYPPAWLFFIPFYLLFVSYIISRPGPTPKGRRMLHLAGGLAIGALLTFPMWMQTFHYLINSIDRSWRNGYSAHMINPKSVASLTDPFLFGELSYFSNGSHFQYVRDCLYIGIPALFFAILAVVSCLRTKVKFEFRTWIIIYGIILVGLISVPFLNSNLYQNIPLLKQTYASNQFVILLLIFSFLAAYGFDDFITISTKTQIVIAAGLFISFILYSDEISIKDKAHHQIYFVFVAILMVSIILWRTLFTRTSQVALILLLQIVSIFPLNTFINWSTSPSQIYPTNQAISFLQKNLGLSNFMPLGNAFLADTDYAYGLSTVAGRGHFSSATKSLYSTLDPKAFTTSETQYLFNLDSLDLKNKTLDLLSVAYLAVPNTGFLANKNTLPPETAIHQSVVFNGDNVTILKHKLVQPYGYFGSRCTTANESGWPLSGKLSVESTLINFKKSAISEFCKRALGQANGQIKYQGDKNLNDPLIINFNVQTQSLFVYPIVWDSNMRLTVDGKKFEPWKVEHDLVGVPLRAGQHTLSLQYKPWYLSNSTLGALLLIFCSISLLILVKSKKYSLVK
jgi:hypothetical protein